MRRPVRLSILFAGVVVYFTLQVDVSCPEEALKAKAQKCSQRSGSISCSGAHQ